MHFKSVKTATMITTGAIVLIAPLAVFAWSTSQSVNAFCNAGSTAAIQVTFKNTESDKSNAMNVVAHDNQSGKEVNLGTVDAGETKNGAIDSGKNSINNGSVTFKLTWTNKSGSDARTANYSAITCKAPTATPTVTPTPKPSATPTPTVTATPTPTATTTPTPTNVPTATPTVTPTIVVTQNNNNNDNTNTNSQSQNQSQESTNTNENNSNSSSSSSSSSDTNITVENTNNVTVEAATAGQSQSQSQSQDTTVAEAPSSAKELPKTGPEALVYTLFGLLPIGLKLRKIA